MSFARTAPAIAELQPEMRLGGFSRYDGTIEFYTRVKLLTGSGAQVVDLGAGRGAWYEDDDSEFRRNTRLLKGHAGHVLGLDVDPVVLQNRSLDSARLIEPGKPWPIADASIDVMVSDYVLEHVVDVDAFRDEVLRVLRPGGWFCARTPTRFNYVCIGARLVRNSRHSSVLDHAQPGRRSEDVFPTAYRLNSRSDIRRTFPAALFEDYSYLYGGEPQYHFGRAWVYRGFQLLHKLLPANLTGNLFVFLRRR